MSFPQLILLGTILLSAVPSTLGHSWIEEYQVISSNGTYTGDQGYSRGYVSRTNVTGGYNGFSMDYLVPQVGVRINSTDLLCHPAQRTSNYSNPLYPPLRVVPGDYVAMKYLENGHVTLPWNQPGKPKGSGTAFVYGTTSPAADERIVDVLQWTMDGKGGNGKGFLMTAQNFDDGRCHQINCGNISIARQELYPDHVAGQPTSSVEQWCETDLQIPESLSPGTLTVYWVWQWPTAPNQDCDLPDGKDEYYTTCADFTVLGGSVTEDEEIDSAPDIHTIGQENPQTTAVSDYKSRIAFTTSPPIIMMEGTQTIGVNDAAASGFLSECSVSASESLTSTPTVSVPTSCPIVTNFRAVATVTTTGPASSAVASQPTSQTPQDALPSSSEANATSVVTMTTIASVTTLVTSFVVITTNTPPVAANASANVVSTISTVDIPTAAVASTSSSISLSGPETSAPMMDIEGDAAVTYDNDYTEEQARSLPRRARARNFVRWI